MYCTSKVFIFLLLITQFLSFEAYAKEKLTYKRYPMIPHGKKFDYPKQIKVSGENLNIKIHPKMGTHYLLGIDQLYISKNLKKKIIVKQDVIPSSKKIINQWVKLSSGSVFHFEKNKKIVAVYAEGYHDRALSEIERQFISLKGRKVSELQYNIQPKSFVNLFVSCAYAEIGISDDYNFQGTDMSIPIGDTAPSTTSSAPKPATSQDDSDSSGESLARCLLRQTGASLGDINQSVVDTVTSAASAVYNDPMGAARATGDYLYGAGEAAVNGVYNAGSAVVSYCLDNCLDMDQMMTDAGNAVDSVYQLGVQLAERVKDTIRGFDELSPAVKKRLVCEIGGQMIANFGVNAVLAFVGGSVLAAPRIALMLNNLEEKIAKGFAALKALGTSNLTVKQQEEIVSGFMAEKMTADEIMAAVRGADPSNTDAPPQAVAAMADPNANQTALAGAAAGRSLDTVEDIYANQPITVTSKSGNSYSGTFVEFIRDPQTNEMSMLLKDSEGQDMRLRVDRLNLNSITGPQNSYTTGRGNTIQPIAGTELGTQMQEFQTSTGMNLVLGKTNSNGANGYHMDYDSKSVTIDQATLSDPAKMESLMSTVLPQAVKTESLVRSNLSTNHGISVSEAGVLVPTNPKSTLGLMVQGLEKRGVTITVNDPKLRSMGALGFATGKDTISIKSDLLLPENEAMLMSALRHEVRHTTSVRGKESNPIVTPSNAAPTPTALAYAGRNIDIKTDTSAPTSGSDSLGSSIYASRFRADEYDARLSQLPKKGTTNYTSRDGAYDDSRTFLQQQGEALHQIYHGNLVPTDVKTYQGVTIVSYSVERGGKRYIIDVPLSGSATSPERASALARQVVEARLKYLEDQYRRRNP